MTAVRHPLFLLLVPFSFFLFLLPLPSLSVPTETDALLKFKESLTNVGSLENWQPKTDPCDPKNIWNGVACDNGLVMGLNLQKMGLSGKIEVDPLIQLQALRRIHVANNSFSGPIPDFSRIGHLLAIIVSDNQFSGEIPSDYFAKMQPLRKIWLSNNKFTGPIPASISKLPNLHELRLEKNEFSGPVPSVEDPAEINTFDLSNNKLAGPIPQGMEIFNPQSFAGNPGLCGKPLGNECSKPPALPDETSKEIPHETAKEAPKETSKPSRTKWVILGIVLILLLFFFIRKTRRREDRFDVLGKENLDDVRHVQMPSSNRRSMNASLRKGSDSMNSSRRGSNRGGAGARSVGDLVVVNEERGVFGLQDLMKAAAEVLGNGGLGSAYKAVMANGVSVVVKRLREMNKVSKDVFDNEIRRLGRLKHRNILTPLAYHYRKEEKLLVSEYVPKGSLLYILHGDRGISHAELNWHTRLKIAKGVARGMGFLHSEFAAYELPHGNLKSSNILLGAHYEPLLSDYAFYPLINNTHTAQSLFAYKCPESILYQQVSHKSDVYCLGIVILEIVTGKFPSQYLNNQKGGTDVVQWVQSAVSEKRESELIDPEITSHVAADALGEMQKLLQVGVACTESVHDQRIDMKEAIRRIEEIQD